MGPDLATLALAERMFSMKVSHWTLVTTVFLGALASTSQAQVVNEDYGVQLYLRMQELNTSTPDILTGTVNIRTERAKETLGEWLTDHPVSISCSKKKSTITIPQGWGPREYSFDSYAACKRSIRDVVSHFKTKPNDQRGTYVFRLGYGLKAKAKVLETSMYDFEAEQIPTEDGQDTEQENREAAPAN